MTSTHRTRRRWVLAPVELAVDLELTDGPVRYRNTASTDDEAIAELLDVAYDGTVDHSPDLDHHAELRTWREVDHADDTASFVAAGDEHLLGASLIGRELAAPILYEIAVRPVAQRVGIASGLLRRTIDALVDQRQIAAWVTTGNTASESLLGANGFWPTTRPLLDAQALTIYRAAAALGHIDRQPGAFYWAGARNGRPSLWIVGCEGERFTVDCGAFSVTVEPIAPTCSKVPEAARMSSPISGAVEHREAAACVAR